MELRRPVPRPGFLARSGLKPPRLRGAGPDRWRRLPLALRAVLVVTFGLLLGLAAAVTGFGTHVSEPSAQGSCSMSGSGATLTANITLASGTTLVEAPGGKLMVQLPGDTLAACSGTGGTNALGGTGGIQAIQFALANPAPNSLTLKIDQTAGSIPCDVGISGTVGNSTAGDGLVQIVAKPGTDVTVGASTIDTNGCGAGNAQGSLKGVGNYLLVANNGAEDLSALGDASDPTTVPVTFQAGRTTTAGDIESFDSSASGSTTLDFSQVDQTCPAGAPTCALVINSSAAATTTTPSVDSFNAELNERPAATQAFTTQTTYDFSSGGANVTQFLGLPVGPTTFYGESGNFTLNSLQPGSQVIAGTGTESYTVAASNTIFTSGAASDTFAVTGNGNTFQAEEGPDNFYDTVPGNAQPSNVVDFSGVGTSSGAPLSVNASGGPQPITINGSACPSPLGNGAAAVGCTAANWTFLNSVGSNSASAFPTIEGATTGSTAFLAGGTGGLTLNGQGSGNSATFLGNTGVVANLSGGPEITSAQIGSSTTLSNFNLGLGQVLVSPPPQGSGNTCTTTPGGDCDTLGGAVGSIATVTGPTSGFSTFYAGAGPGTSTIRDDGNNNTFIGGSGPDAFTSAGNNNTFVAGSGSATFSESTSVQGANNTINFAAASAGSVSGCDVQPCSLEVNVSGSQTAVSDFSAAVTDANGGTVATYGFGTGGSDFTTLIGATGGDTTFDGGLGSYTYTGKGAGNTLNFADVSSGITPLTFDVTHAPLPLATLDNVPETFSGITNLVGLPGPQGNTTFVGGANGGYTFSGNGNNNQASFTSQGPSTTLSVSGLHDASLKSTGGLLTGGTITFSLPSGAVVCPPVPVVNGSASCFSSSLPTPAPPSKGDQVVAIYNPPTGSGLSAAGFILSATGSGSMAASPTSVASVEISQSLSGNSFSAGMSLPLSATVSTLNTSTALPAGTLTFSLAGGQTLCTATVNAVSATTGSVSTETASCPGTFPAGTFDVLAVYAPQTNAVGASVGAYGGNQVTFTSPEVQSTTTSVGYTSSLGGVTCDGSLSPTFFDCASATVQAPNAQSATYTGNVAFAEANGPALCTVKNVTVGALATPVTCSPLDDGFVAVPTGTEVVATFTPATPGAVSASAGVFGPTFGDPFITALTPTSTGLSVSPATSSPPPPNLETVTAGEQETLTATVNSSLNPLPAGGQVVFGVASGSPLCSVGVPGGAPPATVQCQTSFPAADYQDITATYLPPAGSGLGPSAFDQPLDVGPSDNTTGTATSVSAAHAGVAVNLGAAAVVTGAQSPIPGVTVDAGQVLVAAPTGAATCEGSPLPSFCDSITGATTVMGSGGGDNTFVAGSGSENFGDTGSKGGDSIDFSGLSTGAGSALAVNVAGPGLPSLANFTATLGTTATYNFTVGGSNFTNFIGSSGGNTTFYAGKVGGYSFTGSGAGNTVDFSQTTSNPAVTVDLTGGPSNGSITGFANQLPDTISGLTTVTGSPNGSNTFKAGPAPAVYTFTASGNSNVFTGGAGTDVFNSTGNNNLVTVGTGSATFTDTLGSGNKMDFSGLPAPSLTQPAGDPVTVNVSGFQDGSTPNDQATGALGGVYTFGASTTTFNGSPAGSTFDAGGVADTFNGNAAAANNILSFANVQSATVALKVCVVNGAVNGITCPAGQAILGSVPTSFTNITTYKGLPTGNTTFVAGTPSGSTFAAASGTSNNSIDYSAAATGVTVNLGATSYLTSSQNPIPGVTVGSGQVLGAQPPSGKTSCSTSPLPSFCDSISNLTTVTGSSGGRNTFVAGSTSENFGDAGSKGGDSIDFSGLSTNSGSALAVNVAGPAVGPLQNFTATLGTTATYNFTAGGSNFTSFTGPASGNTTFYAGKVGGYSFTGSGSGNTVDFSQTTSNPAVTVNLSGGPSNGSITGFANGSPDTISGLTTVTGSPNGGNTFTAGPGPSVYTFTASGNSNVFKGGAGVDVFNSTGSNNLVTVGTGNATFTDTVGSGNEMDFSGLPAPTTVLPAGDPVMVNVSGFQDGSTQNDQATGALGGVYTFGASTSTFNGSPGGSTFDAGGVQDTFNGIAGAPNTLSFANVQSAAVALRVCVVNGTVNGAACPAGQAILGSVPSVFKNITTYAGLPTGNTAFVAGTPNGSAFIATSGTSNNSIDFSAAVAGVTVNLAVPSPLPGTVGPSVAACSTSPLPLSCDSIANLTNVTGSSQGGNTFVAGSGTYNFTGNGSGNTFSGGAGASTFSSNGNQNLFNVGTGPDTMSDTGTGNAISFKAVPTSSTTLLNVNISITPVNGLLTDTASAGPVTYNFTNGGGGFTSFTGANNGFTYFDAAASGGYSFTGIGPSNTVDFNTDPSGVVANTQTGTVCVSAGSCTSSSLDTIADITTITGSAIGANEFDGDLTGATFKSASTVNTVSYAGYTKSGLCFNLTADQVTPGPACGVSSPADTFKFSNSAGTPTVEGTPQTDTFQPGAANVTIQGGGGNDTLDLSQTPTPTSGSTGATVDLNLGSVTFPGVSGAGTTTFVPGCAAASPTDLCVTAVNGSRYNDTYIANTDALSGFPKLTISGGAGSDSLSLTDIGSAAVVNMPITGTPVSNTTTCSGAPPSATGVVCALSPQAGSNVINFSGIATVSGTEFGGDRFFAGSGTEALTENGAPGTLDYSEVPLPSSAQGISVEADATSANPNEPGGTVVLSSLGVTDTFIDMGTFNGTAHNDTFSQVGAGVYTFNGGAGSNTLNLSLAPVGTQVSLGPPDSSCTTGINNNDGSATGNGVNDNFACMGSVIVPSTSVYQVLPGETATVNGNGSGTLELDCMAQCATAGAATGMGVTVTMPTTANGTGTVTGDGYNFAFTGMSTVDGTPYNDLFTAGAASVTINGGGGSDGVSFAPESAGEVVNLSGSAYTVPSGLTDAGATVPSGTAVGGDGGTITLNGISNVRGTASGNDIIVGGTGPGRFTGGSGSDTFVPTGGNDVIAGGSSTNTLDLSLLPSYSTFNLGSGAVQQLGAGNGTLAVVPGTIQKAIASPSGSSLQAGPGNNITLVGGQGNDWLAAGNAGTGTQTLMAGTGNDTLVGGIGNDIMKGGSQPVTFVPGQGGTDTLSSGLSSAGNILSYAAAPSGAQVNLSTQAIPINGGSTTLFGGTATGGWGATVGGLFGAEINEIIGSPAADTFYTGSTAITILGNGGNDVFQINQLPSGTNLLTAGQGSASTFIFNGAGSNIITGGGNSTVNFSPASTGVGVHVNIPSGQATGGFGGTQTLTGIQNVIGTNYADVLIAGAPGETLTGMNGGTGDVLQTGPTGGDTLVAGGTGPHTFCAQQGCNGMSAPTAGSTMIGGSGGDDFFAQNGRVDHITAQSGDTAFVDPQDVVTGTGVTVFTS